ncbi:autotransporter outer membrane beta-barrel domain-containing protein [Escherichia coli]
MAQWSSNAQDRWHLGVMAGYANQHSNTQSNRVGYKSDGRISGYSAGLYATWYQNDANKTGAYVDSWALYNWFDNSVSSDNRSAWQWGLTHPKAKKRQSIKFIRDIFWRQQRC